MSRLKELERAMLARGVVDVKFFYRPGAAESMPASEFADGVADFVQAYLDGKGAAPDPTAPL